MPQVARELGVCLLTVHRYIRSGRLVADKEPGRNGSVRVSRAALAAFRARERGLQDATVNSSAAAAMLGVTARTVQRLVNSGYLVAAKAPGRTLYITRDSIEAYLRLYRDQAA